MIAPVSKAGSSLVDAANIPLADLAHNKGVTEDAKIAEASRQFEAIFIRQILAEANKSGASKGVASGVYQEMVNDHLADNLTRSGGLGIAHSLQAQLTRHHQIEPAAPGHQTPAAPASAAQDSRPPKLKSASRYL
jgi:flagellar protein FlgJ